MYQLLALFTGVTLAVMISVNGSLTVQYGAYSAAVIIHIVGSIFALLLCALQKEKKELRGHRPIWIYLGGAIGVLTTVFNNLAFGYISMTSIVAIGLLGQIVTALVIDGFGLFGMEKRPFQKTSLYGLMFSAIGILIMLDDTVIEAVMAVCVSFGAGITVVLSRTVNARLSEKVGALRGSLVNHLVGLPITVVVALMIAGGRPVTASVNSNFCPWIYLGGILGVTVVLFCNLTVPKVSAFRLTVLIFIGQVFAGILLDIMIGGNYSDVSFMGGVIVTAGLAIHLAAEQIAAKKARREREYWVRIKQMEDEYRRSLFERYK